MVFATVLWHVKVCCARHNWNVEGVQKMWYDRTEIPVSFQRNVKFVR